MQWSSFRRSLKTCSLDSLCNASSATARNEVYSSSNVERARSFFGGFSDLSDSRVRFQYDADFRRVLLFNKCSASMRSGTPYRAMVSLEFPEQPGQVTWSSLKEAMQALCTCANGDAAGKCVHLVALLMRIGNLQGNIELKGKVVAERLQRNVNSERLEEKRRRVRLRCREERERDC